MSKLNQYLRTSAKICLAAGPLPALIQSLRSRCCLSVLTYHSVIERPLPFYDWSFLDVSSFRRQIEYLQKHFTMLSLSAALDLLDQKALKKPAAVITFDDGFQNNFDVAFPILQEYKVPAIIYLATDLINSDRTIWFTRLLLALQTTRCTCLRWNDRKYRLENPSLIAASSALLQEALKHFPADRLQAELVHIEQLLRVSTNPEVGRESPFRMLDQASISAMVNSGLVEFGAHTCDHAILSRLSYSDKAFQIKNSVSRVAALTGQCCLNFAYPNGAPADFDADSQHLLREAGIRSASTMAPGPNCADTSLLALHRYPVGADTSFSRFKLMVHNVV